MNYLGDFPQDQTVYFYFSTNDVYGGRSDPTTFGTVIVYKDDSTTQTTGGITTTENFDSSDIDNGIHLVKIVTTASFYEPAHDYTVILYGAEIDSQTVNAVLASFSIENRTGSPQAGALEITYTVKVDDEDTGDPLEGVDVWITTDVEGTNVIWRGVTDASGILVETAGDSKPWLDAGTYYFWRQKSGYSFSNPDTETFS